MPLKFLFFFVDSMKKQVFSAGCGGSPLAAATDRGKGVVGDLDVERRSGPLTGPADELDEDFVAVCFCLRNEG